MPLSISHQFTRFAQRNMTFSEVWFNRIFKNGHIKFDMKVEILFLNVSSLILVTDAVKKGNHCLDKMEG